ncbi:MAG: hypothetical protein HKN44_06590 [Ilumatobacter sp.]|nr:hypothetical protein [Ilumatobacter sp.]
MTDDLKHPGASEPPGDEFADWFDREFAPDERSTGERSVTAPTWSPPTQVDDGEATADVLVLDEVDADDLVADPVVAPWSQRAMRRVVRRPMAWWNREWTNERVVRVLVTSTALVTTTVIMMLIVHFNPLSPGRDLLLDDTTPTGGDMGAHVWAPAFLRDHFLPNFQLSGWSMDWYGGLPLYRFYMVIPALAIVALDAVPFVPYGVAFKIVAASGLLTFPLACWAFGRLAAFRHPIPELFAFAGLCFLLDESFEIYGGNVKSTMAGEYSFSIALTLAVLGLGLLAHGLRTGRFRVWTAVVLSLAAVSHGIVLIFVAVGAIIISLMWFDPRRAWFALTTGVTTVLLSAWWVGPFLFGHEFMTDMKYGFRPSGASDSFWDMFFPLTPVLDILITGFAIVGFVAMIVRRHLTGAALGLITLAFVALVYVTRDSLPGIGLLWNPRLLPFVYLLRYMLMVIGALEVITWFVNAARQRLATAELTAFGSAASLGVIGLSCLTVFGFMYETLPFDGRVTEGDTQVYAWGPIRKPVPSGTDYRSRAVADGWTRYNWGGYEARTLYPEYHQVVTTMGDIGENRGCGRALWENNSENGQYGTTMALMLLPHWTDGCIGSMEGLFFEASGTTPYHFLTAAAMSEQSSNPVRELRYTNNDADVGVQHMLDLGVRYVMLRTDPAKAEAARHDGLQFITTSAPWDIYEVSGSRIVEPLTVQPVVVNGRGGDQRERNLELGTSWFQRRDDWPAIPADDGPDDWQRIDVEIDLDARVGEPGDRSRNVDYVSPVDEIRSVALPPVDVSDVRMGQQSVSFRVDQVGVPVLVRVSYFPNWNVNGADGPYRVSPNHMLVIPTSDEVRLTYDRSTLDWFFYALTALAIGLCVLWRRRGDLDMRGESPSWRRRDLATAGEVPVGGIGDADVGDVNVVPDVWTPSQPPDPTPMYLDQPDVDVDAGDATRPSDIVIDTTPSGERARTNVRPDVENIADQGDRSDPLPPPG